MPTETDAIPPPDGALDAFMTRIFGRSWRSGGLGLAALLCGIVSGVAVAVPGAVPAVVVAVAAVVGPLASGAGLMFAKDAKVSGPAK